jgi:hypothetical protein
MIALASFLRDSPLAKNAAVPQKGGQNQGVGHCVARNSNIQTGPL